MVLFPETITSAYFLEGGVLEAAITTTELVAGLERRLKSKLDKTIDVCLGFYQKKDGNLYNSAAYLELGETFIAKAVYQKFFLPTYGVFDEERFVTRGKDLAVFDTRLGKMAILICEDVWHSVMPALCAVSGAHVLLVPAASPARGFKGSTIDNHDRYTRLLRGISEEHGVYCLNAQLCGFEGGKGFIGGSMSVDPYGKVTASAPLADDALILTQIDLEMVTVARAQSPLIADLQSVWEEVRCLISRSGF